MEKMENVTYMQAGPVLIIGLPEEVDDHVCNGIREETDRYISAGKVQKLIFDFSKTGFMDSSGIGILLGRYKRMHHMGGEVLVTGEDAKIRRLLRISGVYCNKSKVRSSCCRWRRYGRTTKRIGWQMAAGGCAAHDGYVGE